MGMCTQIWHAAEQYFFSTHSTECTILAPVYVAHALGSGHVGVCDVTLHTDRIPRSRARILYCNTMSRAISVGCSRYGHCFQMKSLCLCVCGTLRLSAKAVGTEVCRTRFFNASKHLWCPASCFLIILVLSLPLSLSLPPSLPPLCLSLSSIRSHFCQVATLERVLLACVM